MIFLIGTKSSNVKNGNIQNENCPNCKTENSLDFIINREYVHITLIPLFSYGKTVFIKCNHCKENFDFIDLNESIQQKLANEKLKSSALLYIGSFIILLSLLFLVKKNYDENTETSKLIKSPMKGDVYNLKFSNGYYSNMKIEKIIKDSVYTIHNDYNTYMFYDVDDLNKPENYSDKKVNYAKNDILTLYKKGEIIKISREN